MNNPNDISTGHNMGFASGGANEQMLNIIISIYLY